MLRIQTQGFILAQQALYQQNHVPQSPLFFKFLNKLMVLLSRRRCAQYTTLWIPYIVPQKHFKDLCTLVDKEALGTKSDDLSLIPRTHMVEGEKWLPEVAL